jgi:hypothetical protein
MRFIHILIISLCCLNLHPQCQNRKISYASGEDIKYTVFYNWGLFWFNAGWVDFKVKPGNYFGREIYHLDALGSSHESYDWLYKVRDHYQSYLDKETLLPLWSRRENYEGGYEVDHKYTFDWQNKRAFASIKNSDTPFYKDTVLIPECTFDLLSLVYYARDIDYTGLKISQTIPIVTIIENKVYHLYIRYLGKETIEDKKDTKYKCIKFSVMLVAGTIFSGGEEMTIWVTDDKVHVPILIEAKILIGSVKAYIDSATGLKYPIEAKITNAK